MSDVAGPTATVHATTDSVSHAGAPSTDAVKPAIDPATTSSVPASEAAGAANDAAGATGVTSPRAASGVAAGLALARRPAIPCSTVAPAPRRRSGPDPEAARA